MARRADGVRLRLRPIIVAALLLSTAAAADEAAIAKPAPMAVAVAGSAAQTGAADAARALQAALEQRLWTAFAEQTVDLAALPFAVEAPPPSLAERLLSKSGLLPAGNRRDLRQLQVQAEAQALLVANRPYSAALLLMQAEAAAEGPAPDTAALLSQALHAYGTPALAAAALARSRGAAADLQAAALLAAARWQWREGHAADTVTALAGIPALKPSAALQRDASLLRGLAEQRQGNVAAAIKAWSDAQVDPQRLLTASPDERLQAGLARYNLAIALLRGGESERGRQLLDRLGKDAAPDAATRALRDKANVTLGWHFLGDAQGATARPIFERVSLEGPQSTHALLGLGWSALAPQGERQRRGAGTAGVVEERQTPKFVLKAMQRRGVLDCHEYNLRARAPTELCVPLPLFVQDDVPDEAAQLIAKALLPWRTLAGRDSRDPAVREVWTALPHALAQLRQRAEAQSLYDDAILKLGQALAANQQARAGIERGEWLAAMSAAGVALPEPGGMPDAAERVRLYGQLGVESMAADGRFDAAIASIRRSQWLLARAGTADPALDEVLQTQLLALGLDLRSALDEEQSRLRAYLAAARAGLASLNDPGDANSPAP